MSHGPHHGRTGKPEIEPQRLELSLNPEDGSLLTAPLTHVLLTATDGLYQELYQMTHGELDVITATQAPEADEDGAASTPTATNQERKRLSDLSFAERRHEIAWRLAQHAKGLQHVAGLSAAAASSNISEQVRVSSTALQHSRTAWVQADEAQDALFFFHAQLFPIRAAPHDIYGALDVLLQGRWLDLPTDLRLAVDPYETSRPAEWNKAQVQEEWQLALREKLLTGEVGWMKHQQINAPWKVAIRGSRIQITYGKPRHIQNAEARSKSTAAGQETYPLSAWLTVLPIEDDPSDAEHATTEWSLLTLDVTVQAKTGEFNHQLETSNRQRFDLHRLAARAMEREEQKARQQQEENGHSNRNHDKMEPARPLQALFNVGYTFLLSWQLELLSAQAQALRRGIWAAGDANSLEVTPIRFLDHQNSSSGGLLGVLSISFWKVDDSYGPPTLSDLVDSSPANCEATTKPTTEEHEATMAKLWEHIPTSSQLVLCIRADTERGIRVSLSGGSALQEPDTPSHCKNAARDLMVAASNPLALSASDALLAATRLCAEQKCQATVKALRKYLPDWIELTLERCGIVVAAKIQYHGVVPQRGTTLSRPVLFRLGCDARTGSFVSLFSRNTHLLRHLAGNDLRASEAIAVRLASLPSNRRRAARSDSSGRITRDAFDSLIRSMNVLGQRVGVGGHWDDVNEMSASLRERSIGQACRDVRQAIITACGIAALYGLAPLAIGAAFGVTVTPDMAGKGSLESVGETTLLNAPPVGIVLDQEMVETSSTFMDGVTKKKSHIKQSMFALSCTATEKGVTMVPMEIEIVLDSPGSPVERKKLKILEFQDPVKRAEMHYREPPTKKSRCEASDEEDVTTLQEVDVFAEIVCATHDTLLDG